MKRNYRQRFHKLRPASQKKRIHQFLVEIQIHLLSVKRLLIRRTIQHQTPTAFLFHSCQKQSVFKGEINKKNVVIKYLLILASLVSDHSYISKNMITALYRMLQNVFNVIEFSITLKTFSRMALKKQKIRMKKISTYGALI